MPRDINLDGVEISILKALGLSGNETQGDDLLLKIPDIEVSEMIDIMSGLVSLGYVDSDFPSISNSVAFKKARFRVNSGYSHDLKEALDPRIEPPKSRRVRRE